MTGWYRNQDDKVRNSDRIETAVVIALLIIAITIFTII